VNAPPHEARPGWPWQRLFIVALLLRVAYVLAVPGPTYFHDMTGGDPLYFAMIADNIVAGHGFLEKKARAYRPPVYPTVMAGCFALWGDRTLPVQLLLCLCGALHAVLTVLWCRCLIPPRAASCAGWMVALYPQFVRYPQTGYGEPLFLALLALVLWRLLFAAQAGRARQAWGAGLLCGVAALTRETALAVPIAYLLWVAVNRQALPRPGRTWLAFSVGCALAILPWTIRNYVVLDAFIPISTNGGVNVYLGNNPRAAPIHVDWYVVPGVQWDDGANEVEANRQGMAAGLRYIREHPGRTAWMALVKLWCLWRPPWYDFDRGGLTEHLFRSVWLVCYLALLALSGRGLWRSRARWRALALPAWLILGFCAAIVLTKAETRYRLPIIAVLVCYAGLGLGDWRSVDDPS